MNLNPKRPVKPIKMHGGQDQTAAWIVSLMPPRCTHPNNPRSGDGGWLHYVEPYFGGGSVMLALNPEGISEVANDTDGRLMNFWDVLADEKKFGEMKRVLDATPFSMPKWKESLQTVMDEVDDAVRFFVLCRQSLSGRRDAFAAVSRRRSRRGMNEQVSAWLTSIEGLPAVHSRMKRVLIYNLPALKVIDSEDDERTLFYFDPPFMPEARASKGEYGPHEMTPADHETLLIRLGRIKGRFLLSGYRTPLYDAYAKKNGWNRHEKQLPNSSSSGTKKRIMTACVWTNY